MELTIEELKKHQQYWESHLIRLARLPPHKDKEVQEVRDGRIQFAIERVRDVHEELRQTEWFESERRKAEEQAWRDVIPEPHY